MQSAMVADHDVVEHGERQREPRALKRAGDAGGVDALRRHAGQVLAAELRVAARGPVNAGNDVEQRRLARAVRADEAEDRAAPYLQIERVQRHQAAEAHAEGGTGKKRLAHLGKLIWENTRAPGGRSGPQDGPGG